MNKKASILDWLTSYGFVILLTLLAIGIIFFITTYNKPQEDSIAKSRDFCNNNGGNWTNNQCCIKYNSVNRTVDKDNYSCYNLEEINGTYWFTRE